MYRIVHAAPDLSAVPPRLRPLVEATLAKEPRDRPTAPQLLSELTHTAAQPSVGSGNPTQTILAQTWHSSAPGPTGPLRGSVGPPSGSAPLPVSRSSRRRKVLLPVVLALAFVLAAAGTAAGLALAGRSGGTTTPVGTSTTQIRPAQITPANTTVPTTAPPTSPAASTTNPATTNPATTSPATTNPATTNPATTSPATTSPATTSPATTSPATTSPATTSPTSTSG